MTNNAEKKETIKVNKDKHEISCDGGGTLGHPKVYFSFDGKNKVSCSYCGQTFSKK